MDLVQWLLDTAVAIVDVSFDLIDSTFMLMSTI